MSLEQRVMEELKQAMRDKNEAGLRTLRSIKAAILIEKTSEGSGDVISEATELKMLQKLAKQIGVKISVTNANTPATPGPLSTEKQLDLLEKKKNSLSSPGDPEADVAIKLARSRYPTAKSDLAAMVKDKIATDKATKKELDHLLAGKKPTEEIYEKAESWAKSRKDKGKSLSAPSVPRSAALVIEPPRPLPWLPDRTSEL